MALIAHDTAGDTEPSGYTEIRTPVHAVGIVKMGLWLLDNCFLEDLAKTCEEEGRWEFLLTLAPVPFVASTGSALNPIAVF